MNKERLKKLRKLIKESEHLRYTYEGILDNPDESVADVVNDYRTGYPKPVVIRGLNNNRIPSIKDKISRNLREIQEEIAYLEDWILTIDDPETRDILRLLYINGLTQERVAEELGCAPITIKRKLRKVWEREGDKRQCQ